MIVSPEAVIKDSEEYSGCILWIVWINDCLIVMFVSEINWLSWAICGEVEVIALLIFCAISNWYMTDSKFVVLRVSNIKAGKSSISEAFKKRFL